MGISKTTYNNGEFMKTTKFLKYLLIAIGIILVLFTLGIVIKGQFANSQKTFKYEFQKGVTPAWALEIDELEGIRYEISPMVDPDFTSEGSPDWGILAYFEDGSNYTNCLYFYNSRSPGGINLFSGSEIDLQEIDINEHKLVFAEYDGHIEGLYNLTGNCGIVISMDKEVWDRNLKKIITMIKSAKVY